MTIENILEQLDQQIGRLQTARDILVGDIVMQPVEVPAHRPRAKARKKRNLTPEGRKRISDAVKRRWELQRKAA